MKILPCVVRKIENVRAAPVGSGRMAPNCVKNDAFINIANPRRNDDVLLYERQMYSEEPLKEKSTSVFDCTRNHETHK